MKSYIELLKEVLNNGEWKNQRAKTKEGDALKTLSISGQMFKHDLRDGFPLITTKFVSLKTALVELEFFIKGLTDKRWLQERGCNYWNSWSNPKSDDPNDLGPIYGSQWRSFRKYKELSKDVNGNSICTLEYVDQLQNVITELKTNPTSRRLYVTAWNPSDLEEQCLPPCHTTYQFISDGKYLDIIYTMRSVDLFLGKPMDDILYSMLLLIVSKLTNLMPRYMKSFCGDCHIYENHLEQVKEQITRTPYQLPTVNFKYDFQTIDDWTCDNYVLENYQHHPKIHGEVAV